ncbi:hypothetical protein F5880DRAFT_1615485 [Lentinula raphanica]|nr:hypothetical protein F5880DRAFT_1615485 [Lentinula raphanica]
MFDVNNPDNGYLRSYLLVQVYHLIFTSPLSTKDQPKDVENLPTSKKKKTGANCHGNVAQMIHMNELHFALTDAPYWHPSYHGFNYLDLWNFIVDFLVTLKMKNRKNTQRSFWTAESSIEGTRSAANSRGTKMISCKQDAAKQSRRSAPLHNVSTNGAAAGQDSGSGNVPAGRA